MIYYDKKPSVIETEHNGRTRYRYHIERYEQQDEQSGEVREGWQCEEVIVYAPLSSNKLLQAVITDAYPADYEQKLVNEYNSALMGLYEEETAARKIDAYKSFLQARAELKAMVEADCKEAGIR